jgi:hypothetical protein
MPNNTTQPNQCRRCGALAPQPPAPCCPHCGYTPEQAALDDAANFHRQQQMASLADMIATREDQNARRRHTELWGVPSGNDQLYGCGVAFLLLVGMAIIFGLMVAAGGAHHYTP